MSASASKTSLRWISWLKKLALPPAGLLILAWLGLAIPPPLGTALTAFSLAVLTVLAMPGVGLRLLARLERHPRLTDEDLRAFGLDPAADTVVVLDGGRYSNAEEGEAVKPETLERLRSAARLHRATGLPILATGDGAGPLMEIVLREDFGVETEWLETASRNTQENADLSAAILRPLDRRRVLVVTHAWHMPRSARAFERAGFEVIPAPMGFTRPDRQSLRLMSLVPTAGGLETSRRALHESIGLAWYALRYRRGG